MANYICVKRDSFMRKGISPRQRRVFVLRWNPLISSFTKYDFEDEFAQLKGLKPYDVKHPLNWSVWDWQNVMHRDLYVMMKVGVENPGIVWGGFLGGYPCKYADANGEVYDRYYFDTNVQFMHRIENTKILSYDRLAEAVPGVDWLHGHSGEMLSVEDAEKLGLFLVNELRMVNTCKDVYFDEFNEKQYVISDILTYMCPNLKKRLLSLRKIDNKRLRNINNLMVTLVDTNYESWDKLEEHLSLTRLNGILI